MHLLNVNKYRLLGQSISWKYKVAEIPGFYGFQCPPTGIHTNSSLSGLCILLYLEINEPIPRLQFQVSFVR